MSLLGKVVEWKGYPVLVLYEGGTQCSGYFVPEKGPVRATAFNRQPKVMVIADVTVIAETIEKYVIECRTTPIGRKLVGSVCKNMHGIVGIVSAYEDNVYRGKTLRGNPWSSCGRPTQIARDLLEYVTTWVICEKPGT
jgi:hypothetical protein